MNGRYNVSYEDIDALAHPVLRHRVKINIGTSASSAKLTKMTVYVDPVLAILDDLTGKTMEADVKSAKVVLTFGENGAMHLDYNNGVATGDFLLTLTAAAEEGKYNITLEQKAASSMLSMVFDYETANNASSPLPITFITFILIGATVMRILNPSSLPKFRNSIRVACLKELPGITVTTEATLSLLCSARIIP